MNGEPLAPLPMFTIMLPAGPRLFVPVEIVMLPPALALFEEPPLRTTLPPRPVPLPDTLPAEIRSAAALPVLVLLFA